MVQKTMDGMGRIQRENRFPLPIPFSTEHKKTKHKELIVP